MRLKATVSRVDEQRAFNNLDKLFAQVSQGAFKAASENANEYNALVRSGIGVTSTPSFVSTPWKELSDYWKKIKTANVEKFWIETGGILKQIKTKVLAKTQDLIIVFGGIEAKDDPDAFKRAIKNEFGFFGLAIHAAARPLFRPAIEMFAKMAKGERKMKRNTMAWARFRGVIPRAIKRTYK